MERSKRSLVFWVLLLATVIAPLTSAQVKLKKQLYQASIFNSADGNGVGNAMIVFSNQGSPDYSVRADKYGSAVVKVGLESINGAWGLDSFGNPKQVVLCENGGPSGDCTYGTDGNLDIDGDIVALMISAAGITPVLFQNALVVGSAGLPDNLKVILNDGIGLTLKGEGGFIRQF